MCGDNSFGGHDAMGYFERDGYTVIRGVLTPSEVVRAKRSLAHAQGTHSRGLWNIRCNPMVKKSFADVWGVRPEQLLTSFDGSYHRRAGEQFSLPWHMDHNASHPFDTLSSVQGVLALTDVDETTGGTQLLVGSHKRTRALCDRLSVDAECDTWEYVSVPEGDRVFSMGCTLHQPSLAAGDVLLWDSRLVHRVVGPTGPCTERWTVYLSMAPAEMVTPSVRAKRKRGFRNGVSTTHWVQNFVDRGDERIVPSRNVLHDPRVRIMV